MSLFFSKVEWLLTTVTDKVILEEENDKDNNYDGLKTVPLKHFSLILTKFSYLSLKIYISGVS